MGRGKFHWQLIILLSLSISSEAILAGPLQGIFKNAHELKRLEGGWNLGARKKFLTGLGRLGESSSSIPRRGKTLIFDLAGPRSTDSAMVPFRELQGMFGKDSVKYWRKGEDLGEIADMMKGYDSAHIMGHGLGGEWMGAGAGSVVSAETFQHAAIQKAFRGKVVIFDGCGTAWTHSPEGVLNTKSLFYSATVHGEVGAVVGMMGWTTPVGNRMFLDALIKYPGRIPLVGAQAPAEIRAFNDLFRVYNSAAEDGIDVVESRLFRNQLR